MTQRLHVFAPAKLNLFLHITGKRSDGYHLLDSLFAFTEFGDALDIEPSDALSLSVTGPFAAQLTGDQNDNLTLRAARALKEKTGVSGGARILLHKHIPVGAGLGGGSADAAATLRGLRKLWNISVSDEALKSIAVDLGADVAACVDSKTTWARGVGEELEPVNLAADFWITLVNPGVPLMTADVYRGFKGPFARESDAQPSITSLNDLLTLIQIKKNALEAPAMALSPAVGQALSALRSTQNCLLARMSGSGATCFGIYADRARAELAEQAIRAAHPDWFLAITRLRANDKAAA